MTEHETAQDRQMAATASTAEDTGSYYGMQVDARGDEFTDSLYDIAEKLLGSELQNARQSLERLWALKKEAQATSTLVVDELIEHYEGKLATLREREEQVQKVSVSSKDLLQKRREGQTELVKLQKEIGDLTAAVADLQERLDKLRRREEELSEQKNEISGELETNEKTVMETLHEIITSRKEAAAAPVSTPPPVPRRRSSDRKEPDTPQRDVSEDTVAVPVPAKARVPERKAPSEPRAAVQNRIPAGAVQLAKSVVKTTRGRVLAEYYYDPTVAKGGRHYVFNSKFLAEQLGLGLEMLRKDYDRENHAELAQMLQDARNRVGRSKTLHFEVSTADVVNQESLQEVWNLLRTKHFDEVEEFCGRLQGKLDTLGANYRRLLKAQMDKLVTRS